MTSTSWTYSFVLHTFQLEGITQLRLPTCPFHLSHPLSPAHPLIHAIHDITVVVKKVAQNPAVLASYYMYVDSHETLAKRLLASGYTTNLAWLQSSTREPWGASIL